MVKAKGLTRILALQNGSSEVVVEHICRQWSLLWWVSVGIKRFFSFLLLLFGLWISFLGKSFIDAIHHEFTISITTFLVFESTAFVGLESFRSA